MEEDNLISSIDDVPLRQALGESKTKPGPGLLNEAIGALDAATDSLVECIIEGLADHAHATCSFRHLHDPDDAGSDWVAAGFTSDDFARLAKAEESPAHMSGRRDETPSIVIDRILSTDVNSAGQPIVFPQERGQVDVSIYEIKPGAVLPLHKHPFPRMGYVLSGMLRVTNTDTETSSVYVKGDFALEAVDRWHVAENIGDDLIKLLVIDLVERGTQNTVTG